MTPEDFNNICKEFDAAPDDHAWDEDHPIFKLAQENDRLQRLLDNESLTSAKVRLLRAARRQGLKTTLEFRPV